MRRIDLLDGQIAPLYVAAIHAGATWYYFTANEVPNMTVKPPISLTDAQYSFARKLVEAGRYSSVITVLQQRIDVLWQSMQDEDLERAALKALLDQRAAGAFVSSAQMNKSIGRMIANKRRAHVVQN